MKSIVLALLVLASSPVFSQIKFIDNKTSWEDLSALAKAQKKLIFIHFENSECQQCNEVATKGFSDPILAEKFAKNFVSIRLNVETENGLDFKSFLRIQGSLLSVFVDPEGNIMEQMNGSTSNSMAYSDKADIALSRKGTKGINEYAKEYQAGNYGPEFLKSYLVKLRELQMSSDEVLDKYTSQLPEDSLKSFSTVKFIYQQGPAIDSETYKRIGAITPARLIDSIYRSVSYPEAVEFNNRITGNSMRNAIMKRDHSLAERTARFAFSTHPTNRTLGRIAYDRNMLQYYYAVRDTANYLAYTTKFIREHYMSVSLDSLKALDRAEMERVKAAMKPATGKGVNVMSFKTTNPSQFYPMELNNRAFHFYQMATSKEDLENALVWAKTAMEWSQELIKNVNKSSVNGNPSIIDTYAHLLYKLGQKEEAISWQAKALEQQKAMGIPHGAMETELTKMKAGTL